MVEPRMGRATPVQNYDQRLAAVERLSPRPTSGRVGDGHDHTFGLRRAKVLVPKTLQSFDGSTAATFTPTTSGMVGAVFLHAPIFADRITYFPNGGGSANAVIRIALYTEDGQRRLRNVTDAVGAAAAGERSITFGAIDLPPGNYYVFACLASGTTSPALVVYNTGTAFGAGLSGEPDMEGRIVISGGNAPATFDPTAMPVVAPDMTIVFRLDGV